MTQASEPTINLVFLHSLIEELKDQGCTEVELCRELALSRNALRDATQALPANHVYRFLSWATEFMGNPSYCFLLGERMASGGWSPIAPLFERNKTVVNFISDFAALAEQQGRAARYKLEIEGRVAVLILSRPPSANALSRHADAIAAGFFVSLLKGSNAETWDTSQVTAVLPDRNLVPEEGLPSSSVLCGRRGLSLRFPSKFLGADVLQPAEFADGPELQVPEANETEIAASVQQIIELRLGERKLGPEEIAEALGMKKWKLQTYLNKTGSSVSLLKEKVKSQEAKRRLKMTSDTVERIAQDLGYSDSANFARAFRKWNGVSPTSFRSEFET
jgi:AraC-like DNA-binding protein